MKKTYYLFAALLLIVFISSCGDDEELTGPTPTAEFSSDKAFAETGDEIVFTNTTIDGDTYRWDFGDGDTSTEENPRHTYTTTGNYTVTLTAIGTGGRENESTLEIVVGSRNAIGFVINKLDLQRGDGSDWDDDNTPPDIMLLYASESQPNGTLIILENDVELDELPIGVNFSESLQFVLTNENWAMGLLDNDAPFDTYDEESTEEMFIDLLNPTEGGVIDYETGEGFITISDDDDRFDVAIVFQITN